MKAKVNSKEYEGKAPRDCYDAAMKDLAFPGMTIKDCKAIKAQVLESLDAKDWHPEPSVVAPAKEKGFIGKLIAKARGR